MQLGLPLWAKLLSWFLAGSAWSVFQIALGSTLLLDLSQSEQRTEAAHIYYWFSRLALVFGTLLARLVPVRDAGYSYLLLSLAFLVAAWLLVFSLSVPFRAPLNPPLFSLDRFWLPRGVRLFLPVLFVSAFAGLSLGCVREAESGLFLGAGFLTALIVHRHLFKDGMQAEVISGFVLLLVSCAVFGWFSESYAGRSVSVGVLGAGLGFTASRFLLAFIRICEHCEPGYGTDILLVRVGDRACVGFHACVCPAGKPPACACSPVGHLRGVSFFLLSLRCAEMVCGPPAQVSCVPHPAFVFTMNRTVKNGHL